MLSRLIDTDIVYGALGDLEEQYRFLTKEKGRFNASFYYWLQILAVFPGFVRNKVFWSFVMILNNIKFFLRNLRKHKGYSFLNLAGFTTGITVFLLIVLFVQHELSFDGFNKNIDRIYRIQGPNGRQPYMAPAIGKRIRDQIPDIEKVVRFKLRNDFLAYYHPGSGESERTLIIRDFVWADPEVFDVFTFPFVAGDPATAFASPFSLVLTEDIAARLFGSEYPIGKTLKINNQHEYQITGVIKTPERFHLSFDVLAPFENLGRIIGPQELDSFNSWNLATYVLLPPDYDAAVAASKITALFERLLREKWKVDFDFELAPLKGIYFSNTGHGKRGNLQAVQAFIAVAVFILLIACVNFINLSTARASIRAKEVGIKKVVGSSRRRLISQFLGESALFCLICSLAAFAFSRLFIEGAVRLFQRDLSFDYFLNPMVIGAAALGAVVVGILAGAYPAFYLSSFLPSTVLKQKYSGVRSGVLRKILISTQFAISICLMITTLIVLKQLHYVKNQDLGFQKEHILYFEFARNRAVRKNKAVFRERMLQYPGILDVTYSQGRPGLVYNWEGFEYKGKRDGYAVFTVEPEFFGVYGLKIVAGRNFSPEFTTDRINKCLLNETAVRKYGLEEPVGAVLHHDDVGGSAFRAKDIEVIGVVKDFHYQSFHYAIQPMIFGWNPGWHWMASVKLSGVDIPGTVAYIRDLWQEFSPEFPFEYHFITDLYYSQYQNEERLGRLIGLFTALGIGIACLGLFGLASFMSEMRTKEIGIRKVLGAGVGGLILLLSKEFSKWVLVANFIAWPAAYFAVSKWLEGFAYRTPLGVWPFLLATFLTFLIAMLSISYRSIRAVTTNPIHSLRYE
jgi:putative ABC transport system permease protein